MHPADLGAVPIKAIVERTGINPDAVDDVVWGCLDAIGPQAGNMGRTAWLAAFTDGHDQIIGVTKYVDPDVRPAPVEAPHAATPPSPASRIAALVLVRAAASFEEAPA